MNEQMEELITTSSEKLLSYVEAAEGFVVTETPLSIQEILRFSFWESFIWVIIECIFIFLCAACITGVAKLDKDKEEISDGAAILIIISAVIGVYALGASITNIINCLQIYIAPRMWLLEYLGEMVG